MSVPADPLCRLGSSSAGARLAPVFVALSPGPFKNRVAAELQELLVGEGEPARQAALLREALVFLLPFGLAHVLESCELAPAEAALLQQRMVTWLAECAEYPTHSIQEILDKAEAALLLTHR